MTDDVPPTTPPSAGLPSAGPTAGPTLPAGTDAHDAADRVRIEQTTPPKRLDALPVVYLVGFVILAASLIYLWKHPGLPRNAALEVARMDTVRAQVNAVQGRVDQLEARKPADVPPQLTEQLAQLQARVAELAAQPKPVMPPPPDLAPLQGRLTALENKPAPPPVDLSGIEGRIAALEGKPPVDLGPLQQRVDALGKKDSDDLASLGKRLDAVEAQGRQATQQLAEQLGKRLDAVALQAQLAGKLQAAAAALAAGQSLGDLPGAPPALARFAHEKPPTEAGLRVSFEKAAEDARRASEPALTDNQPLLSRMWTRAQQSVTVRQGDHVLVGDPIAGVIASARTALDAGDVAGAVKALDALNGPAKAAMAGWVGQAQSLVDARAAIGAMGARG